MELILKTERLILRPFKLEDAEAMFYGWANDDEVTKYLTWNTHESIEDTKAILNQWIQEYEKPERLNFAITLKDTAQLIGGIDVVGYLNGISGTPVIGYNLSRKFWNKGYMTEACKCLIDYLFSKGYSEIRIDAMAENTASIKVIEKCGGIYQGSEEEFFSMKNKAALVNKYIVMAESGIYENSGDDRMNILNLETKMWQAAKSGDKTAFLQLVSADAVMVCGGYRCTGAEYAEFISDFEISAFEITDFEIVLETNDIVLVHYIVRTTADSPENADMAGKFHVTSTWRNFDGEWKLVFNMDSRIWER